MERDYGERTIIITRHHRCISYLASRTGTGHDPTRASAHRAVQVVRQSVHWLGVPQKTEAPFRVRSGSSLARHNRVGSVSPLGSPWAHVTVPRRAPSLWSDLVRVVTLFNMSLWSRPLATAEHHLRVEFRVLAVNILLPVTRTVDIRQHRSTPSNRRYCPVIITLLVDRYYNLISRSEKTTSRRILFLYHR